MPNMPDLNKKFVNSLLPLELIAKIKKGAIKHKMTTTEFIVWILERELEKVQLTSEDYIWIANEVKKNEENRRNANTKEA